ncbi:hypothetical protein M2163_000297 [Streptomyces sp. SAI-135]|jgi:hypothetical protein|uniref:hypothetical protein n=1 Tax=unclassified Streptomyces TaxID=2593676 RepID=UPI002476F821|nr:MULTISPECIES: hypothetical protein [unclassified Streptomyces]MDH6523198.1 hypothetical protein [Streptomyces sp. SAI-090]MDH6554810.1 hypothetical protein [Streptomyces sp. SAI-041]MDH6574082.1 hypothetical protein [Streptomyces sp. SAI-117]MDH6581182.1 hypothetical protein [Streptomyces sp. SAI-133]MDH6613189.1 hypothetical protein [Streptomyces sp. SAI-135]
MLAAAFLAITARGRTRQLSARPAGIRQHTSFNRQLCGLIDQDKTKCPELSPRSCRWTRPPPYQYFCAAKTV